MIVREMGVRQGCRALATAGRPTATASLPLATGWRRALSTTPTPAAPAETTTAEPPRPVLFDASRIASTRARKDKQPEDPYDIAAAEYSTKKATRKALNHLGTSVERTYAPDDIWTNPPGPKDVTLELLMASQAHMGHHTSLWNPANARYIFGIRQGIHIISLEQTAAHLRRAARLVEDVAFHAGTILFVGNRRGHTRIVTEAARLAGGCHLFTKWTPGTITNAEVLLRGVPLKMVDAHDQHVKGFYRHVNSCRPLVPDLVVCLNPTENYTMLHECALANIPTISVLDTNAEPSWSTYNIPANDDSMRCLSVIASVLGRAGQLGNTRRRKAAENGKVPWETPVDVESFISSKNAGVRAAQKASSAAEMLAQEQDATLLPDVDAGVDAPASSSAPAPLE